LLIKKNYLELLNNVFLNFFLGVSYTPISGAPEAAPGQTPYGAYPHQVA